MVLMGRSVAEERALEIVLSVYPHTDGGSYVTSDYCLSEEFFVEEPFEHFCLKYLTLLLHLLLKLNIGLL